MKEVRFHYSMRLAFDSPISNHRFTLKCIPMSNARQQIEELEIDVFPNRFISRDTDSFGNACIYGYSEEEHSQFYIDVKGVAKTGLCKVEPSVANHLIGYYKYQTECTKPGEAIRAFHDTFAFDGSETNLAKAQTFMEKLYQQFQYVQGVTVIGTTAEEAMRMGKGVCQDYSHILLSLCRMEQIPARYIVGMLMGEGLSHAWIEIYQDSAWIALDPTNNLMVDDQHIKISNGRDFEDCKINQGVFFGNANQSQKVSVVVEEINN